MSAEALRRLDELGVVTRSAPWTLDDAFVLILALSNTWLALPGARVSGDLPSHEHQAMVVRTVASRLFADDV